MTLIRVFPRRTKWTPMDPYAFVGDPPMIRPEADEVHVSCTFTWDMAEARRLRFAWLEHYERVYIGGPAINPKGPDTGFVPGRYITPGVTFTTRGCNKECPWCLVPDSEGKLRVIEDFADGPILQDNNFLQAPPAHRARVYRMLNQKHIVGAYFTGGLEAALVSDEVAEELRGCNVHEVFLAADTEGAEKPLAKAIKRLSFLRDPSEDRRGEPARAIRVYMLLAYGGEIMPQAEARLERVWELGGMPFPQLWQPPDRWIDYSPEWRALARKWSRPAAMIAAHRTP